MSDGAITGPERVFEWNSGDQVGTDRAQVAGRQLVAVANDDDQRGSLLNAAGAAERPASNGLLQPFRRAGITIEDYPEGVYVDWRDGFWVAVNYSSRPANIPLRKGAEILLGKTPLKPADVLLWK